MGSFRALWGLVLEEPEQHEVLQSMLLMGTGRHIITWLYKVLNGMVHKLPLRAKTNWETDMGDSISEEEWVQALEQIKKISCNTRLKFTHFNYVHQTYLSPYRITRMFGETRDPPRAAEN